MTTEEKFNNWWHKHYEPANGQKDDLYTGKETITMPATMYKDDIKSAYTAGLKEATKECNEYFQNELDEVYKNYADRLKDVLKRNEELKTKLAFLNEINKALDNENTELKKDKEYFSDNLDKQVDATLNVMKQLNEAKNIIKDLLNNSDEYCRQRAFDFIKE